MTHAGQPNARGGGVLKAYICKYFNLHPDTTDDDVIEFIKPFLERYAFDWMMKRYR